jgi:hypothetical protein
LEIYEDFFFAERNFSIEFNHERVSNDTKKVNKFPNSAFKSLIKTFTEKSKLKLKSTNQISFNQRSFMSGKLNIPNPIFDINNAANILPFANDHIKLFKMQMA